MTNIPDTKSQVSRALVIHLPSMMFSCKSRSLEFLPEMRFHCSSTDLSRLSVASVGIAVATALSDTYERDHLLGVFAFCPLIGVDLTPLGEPSSFTWQHVSADDCLLLEAGTVEGTSTYPRVASARILQSGLPDVEVV